MSLPANQGAGCMTSSLPNTSHRDLLDRGRSFTCNTQTIEQKVCHKILLRILSSQRCSRRHPGGTAYERAHKWEYSTKQSTASCLLRREVEV